MGEQANVQRHQGVRFLIYNEGDLTTDEKGIFRVRDQR